MPTISIAAVTSFELFLREHVFEIPVRIAMLVCPVFSVGPSVSMGCYATFLGVPVTFSVVTRVLGMVVLVGLGCERFFTYLLHPRWEVTYEVERAARTDL